LDKDYQQETFRLETDHWWYRARRKIILAQFDHRFGKRKDLRILDIGCGAGTLLSDLCVFGQATGLDASAEAAQVARKRSSCFVHVGAIPDSLPAGLGEFDVVNLFDVIEHLDDDVKALRCARELLVADGTLFVTVPALPALYGIHDEINEHRRRYTRAMLTSALNRAGFGRIRVSYFNLLLSPLLIPAIVWRNLRRQGHHFTASTPLSPVLEFTFALERHLLRFVRLPFGLSLLAVAEKIQV